jgi:hypothetical protein
MQAKGISINSNIEHPLVLSTMTPAKYTYQIGLKGDTLFIKF